MEVALTHLVVYNYVPIAFVPLFHVDAVDVVETVGALRMWDAQSTEMNPSNSQTLPLGHPDPMSGARLLNGGLLSSFSLSSSLDLIGSDDDKFALALADFCARSTSGVCAHGAACSNAKQQIAYVAPLPDVGADVMTKFTKSFLKCWRGHTKEAEYRACSTCSNAFSRLPADVLAAAPALGLFPPAAAIRSSVATSIGAPVAGSLEATRHAAGLGLIPQFDLIDYSSLRKEWAAGLVCKSVFGPACNGHGTKCTEAKAQIEHVSKQQDPGDDEWSRKLKAFVKCWQSHGTDATSYQRCSTCKDPYNALPGYLIKPGAMQLPVLPPMPVFQQPSIPWPSLPPLQPSRSPLPVSFPSVTPFPTLSASYSSAQPFPSPGTGAASAGSHVQEFLAMQQALAAFSSVLADAVDRQGKATTQHQAAMGELRVNNRIEALRAKTAKLNALMAGRGSTISTGLADFEANCKLLKDTIELDAANSSTADALARKSLVSSISAASADLAAAYSKQLREEKEAINALEAAETALAQALAAGEDGKILSEARRVSHEAKVQQCKQHLSSVQTEGAAIQASANQKLQGAVKQLESASMSIATTNETLKRAAAAVKAAAARTVDMQKAADTETKAIAVIQSEMAATKAAHASKLAQLASEMRELIEQNAFLNGRLPAEDAVYVIDASGSMSCTSRWGLCSGFLRKALQVHQRLRADADVGRSDRVGVVIFNTSAFSLNGFNSLVDATAANVSGLVGRLGASGPGGGTSILRGVKVAAGFGAREIYLLSDCEDWINEGAYRSVLGAQLLHVCYCGSSSSAAAFRGFSASVSDVSSLVPV